MGNAPGHTDLMIAPEDIDAALDTPAPIATPEDVAAACILWLADLAAMHEAPSGVVVGDTFHAKNWQDKPHRVLYDAIKIARAAISVIAERSSTAAEIERLTRTADAAITWERSVADTLEARVATLTAEVGRLREALTPSGETKAAYIGEFTFDVPDRDEDGNERRRKIMVPWTTTKEIMAAILARAALSPEPKET